MPPRRPRPSASSSSASRANRRLALIDAAFDAAVSPSHTPHSDARPPPRKKAKKAVVLDDEEGEDDEMELVVGDAAAGGVNLGGGFLPEPPAKDFAGGGGFLPEDDTGGGGFLPEDSGADLGGGFLPEPPANADTQLSGVDTGGGFLLDDFSKEGGFLPLPPPPLAGSGDPMAVDYSASTSAAGGGGFLPDPPAEFSSAGGFLPDPSASDPFLTLPTPVPPPSRIPLTSIPPALRSLGLHRLGLAGADLMALFEEVASDDEDAEGGRSVRRERFREACEVLMGDTDEEDGSEEEYRDEEEDEEEEGKSRRRLRRAGEPTISVAADDEGNDAPKLRRQPARRSTRANPLPEDEDVSAKDFGAALDALPDDSESSLSEAATDSEDDVSGSAAAAKKKGKSPAKSKGKKPRRGRRGNPNDITAEDVVAAEDTFDLFFEESPQSVLPKRERGIGLMELQRACRVLKEKMTDGDLNEMLEYAGRSKGLVDLESFARILVETGL
ncbi:hypothetical protein JCM10296v2_006627 [Rhodotorula toruloides]